MSDTYKATKFYQLLESLPSSNQQDFIKYLKQTPNTINKDLLKLTKLSLKVLENAFSSNTNDLFDKIYGKKNYSLNKVHKFLSKAYQILENFILLDYQNKKEPIHNTLFFLNYYRHNKLNNLFSYKCKSALKLLEQDKKQSLIAFDLKRKLYFEIAQFSTESLRTRTKYQGDVVSDIDTYMYWNESYYLLSQIEWLHAKIPIQKKKEDKSKASLQAILTGIERSHTQFPELITSFYHLSKAILEVDEIKWYQISWDYFSKHADLFGQEENFLHITIYQNYCTVKVLQGALEFYQQLFEIYNFQSSHQLILVNNELHPNKLKNIITTAIRNKQLDWAIDFLKKYEPFLKGEEKTSIIQYLKSLFAFEKKDFAQAQALLLSIPNFKDIYYNLSLRTLEIKLYYETQELDLLESCIESYYLFIYRNKIISDTSKELRKNFILLLKRLVKNGHEKEKLLELKAELEQPISILEIDWLEAKIEELL